MRKHLLFLGFALSLTYSLPAQVPDPGAMQDHEAEREKLLKASDQLDNIQANSEATKVAVDGMKNDVAALQNTVTQLQTQNAMLKQQLADMQAAFDAYKAQQAKDRQTLIDNVAGMIAASKASAPKTAKKKSDEPESTPVADATPKPIPSSLAPPPDPSQPPAAADNPPPKKKGYYHVVASGETLAMICEAYRDNGVNVTVAQVRKANGLTADSTLKTGQKLFIPKPASNL